MIYIYICVCRLQAEYAISLGGAPSCGRRQLPSALTYNINYEYSASILIIAGVIRKKKPSPSTLVYKSSTLFCF